MKILMFFLGMVDRVFRNGDDKVFLGHGRLTAQARLRFEPPRAIEKIFLGFASLVQGFKSLTHDAMAGGAGAAHVARMFYFNPKGKQSLTDRGADPNLQHGAFGRQFGRAFLRLGRSLVSATEKPRLRCAAGISPICASAAA